LYWLDSLHIVHADRQKDASHIPQLL